MNYSKKIKELTRIVIDIPIKSYYFISINFICYPNFIILLCVFLSKLQAYAFWWSSPASLVEHLSTHQYRAICDNLYIYSKNPHSLNKIYFPFILTLSSNQEEVTCRNYLVWKRSKKKPTQSNHRKKYISVLNASDNCFTELIIICLFILWNTNLLYLLMR